MSIIVRKINIYTLCHKSLDLILFLRDFNGISRIFTNISTFSSLRLKRCKLIILRSRLSCGSTLIIDPNSWFLFITVNSIWWTFLRANFCLKRPAADAIYKKKGQKGAKFVELWRVSWLVSDREVSGHEHRFALNLAIKRDIITSHRIDFVFRRCWTRILVCEYFCNRQFLTVFQRAWTK